MCRRGSIRGSQLDLTESPAFARTANSRYYSPLMSKGLPETIDPVAYVDKGRSIEGECPLTHLERLQDAVVDPVGSVRFRLAFGREGSVAAIRGSLKAELILQCQSCLGPMRFPVESVFALGLVASIDEANRLPEPFEPLLLDGDGSLRVLDVIEDEILLALPQVPRHPACGSEDAAGGSAEPAAAVRERAFAGLGSMLSADDKNKQPR